jgi:hypothetical protein
MSTAWAVVGVSAFIALVLAAIFVPGRRKHDDDREDRWEAGHGGGSGGCGGGCGGG